MLNANYGLPRLYVYVFWLRHLISSGVRMVFTLQLFGSNVYYFCQVSKWLIFILRKS